MSEPFLAEVRMFGFNFAPRGWGQCDGQILPINQNQSLYSLLGTTYGGDGRTTFALPDLRSRTPMHVGTGFPLGKKDGQETHVLSAAEMPAHKHTARGSSSNADAPVPSNFVLATAANLYHDSDTNNVPLRAGTTGDTGNSQGHQNMSPYLTINFCIALTGLFPSRN